MENQSEVIEQLVAVGAHLGYSRSRTHPSARRFVYGFKNRLAVINLETMVAQLLAAKEFIRGLGEKKETILLVGTKNEAKQPVAEAALALAMPYVTGRWLGGIFTNWSQIKSRLDRLAALKEERATGKMDVYTKKERVLFDKEIARLSRYLSTIASLTKLPTALVLIDSGEEAIAAAEARKVSVPIVSLSGSDSDLRGIDYPVVANDSSPAAIRYFLNQLVESYHGAGGKN